MPTPSSRTPVRIARGTYSNLNSSISDLQEGEICYATDQDKLYVKEGSSLVSTQADVSAKANTADIGVTIQGYDADTAKTDVAQTYTAGQRGQITTLTSNGSGSLSMDFADSNNFYVELSENLTNVVPSNAANSVGQSGSIFIKQPASGGPYTVGGWNAAFLFSGGSAPSITQTASKCDRVDYVIRSATEIQVVWTGNY